MALQGDYRHDYAGSAAIKETLMSQLASTEKRLMDIRQEVRDLADQLCGAQPPQPVAGQLSPGSNGVGSPFARIAKYNPYVVSNG